MSSGPFGWAADDLAPLRLEPLAPGLFRTPLLTGAGCARFLAEAERRQSDARPAAAPNSMHEHGVALAPLGLDGAVDALLRASGIGPAIRNAFADELGDALLDGHHSYLVDYGPGADEDLGFHVDDSEVTLNLCLGDTFSGAELVMLGRRCDVHRQTPVRPSEIIEIDHEPGTCVLHLGRHRHRVDPILRGRRRNLIAWLRSSTLRDGTALAASGAAPVTGHCPPWCDH